MLIKNTHQFTGALQEAQVPGQDGRELRHAGRPPAGEVAGLQDHHARWEQGEPDELHRQRAGKMATETFTFIKVIFYHDFGYFYSTVIISQISGKSMTCFVFLFCSIKGWIFFLINAHITRAHDLILRMTIHAGLLLWMQWFYSDVVKILHDRRIWILLLILLLPNGFADPRCLDIRQKMKILCSKRRKRRNVNF